MTGYARGPSLSSLLYPSRSPGSYRTQSAMVWEYRHLYITMKNICTAVKVPRVTFGSGIGAPMLWASSRYWGSLPA
jgi:hypothetical protein